jgi:DNA-binding PadR family transcriptional regulator
LEAIMAKPRKVSNLLALGVLSVLVPGRPMHPYEMANVLKRTGKERDLNIKWGSFYTVVGNLEKHGFIVATGSDSERGRPERTTYTLTEAGQAELRDWLHELIAEPEPENPRFGAALSVITILPPHEVVFLLRQRLEALGRGNAADAQELDSVPDNVPRVFLIEAEYALAIRRAEADWTRGLLAEIEAGTLPGLEMWRRTHETGQLPPEWAAVFEGGAET